MFCIIFCIQHVRFMVESSNVYGQCFQILLFSRNYHDFSEQKKYNSRVDILFDYLKDIQILLKTSLQRTKVHKSKFDFGGNKSICEHSPRLRVIQGYTRLHKALLYEYLKSLVVLACCNSRCDCVMNCHCICYHIDYDI